MKRIIIALAILCCVQIADAQVKSAADLKKAVESAEADATNPKKAESVSTWLKIAEAYKNAYSNPQGQGWIGASKMELQLVLGNDKPQSTEEVVVSGVPYTKDIFATRNYYYNEGGVLDIIEVTKPVYEDPLARALAAYKTAYEKDAKHSKTKDISAGIADVASKYLDDAINQYKLGDAALASRYFEAAAEASATAPYSVVDSLCIYNAGFTAWASQDNERAKKFFRQSVEIGYYEGGESYAKLADVYYRLKDTLSAKAVLEEGFAKFPENQGILIGLINYYVTSGEDPNQLFNLLDIAKKNEPNNPSLYYVEGDIHNKLGDKDAAIASYLEASKISPDYEFGYIGIGMLYYNEAIDIQEQAATEMDDTKYMALVDDFEAALLNAGEAFEKAFDISKSNEIKTSIAEYLKNIYYRFSSKDAKYAEAYEKYSKVLSEGL